MLSLSAQIKQANANATFIPKRVALLKGGWSKEREISLKSAKALTPVLTKLGKKLNFTLKVIDVTQDIEKLIADLKTFSPNLVFMNALHGRFVEDGHLQGLIAMLGFHYTGSNVLASALSMDKHRTKDILDINDVSVPYGRKISYEQLSKKQNLIPYPFVLKPLNEGSSIGVCIVHNFNDVQKIINNWNYEDNVLIEDYIIGREFAVPMLGTHPLGIIEVLYKEDFLDYHTKYNQEMFELVIPELPKEIFNSIIQEAQKTVFLLGNTGVSRVDILFGKKVYDCNKLDAPEVAYVLENNSLPGMTETSFIPSMSKKLGINYEDVCEWMLKNPIL